MRNGYEANFDAKHLTLKMKTNTYLTGGGFNNKQDAIDFFEECLNELRGG